MRSVIYDNGILSNLVGRGRKLLLMGEVRAVIHRLQCVRATPSDELLCYNSCVAAPPLLRVAFK